MALQHTLLSADNHFGTDFTDAYTIVQCVEVINTPTHGAPAVEAGAPTTLTKHTMKFTTYTYPNKAAKDAGKGPIAQHNYIEGYSLESTAADNVIEYIYEWLKANIAILNAATLV